MVIETRQSKQVKPHSLADLMVTIIEQVKKSDTLYRKEREDYWNSEILPKENYCYLENNNLKFRFLKIRT